METSIIPNEAVIRLGFFFAILVAVALWELARPRRRLTTPKARRWLRNLGITVLNSALVRWLFPVLAMGMAALAETRGWGLLNAYALPYWLAVALAVVVLDFAIYLQHVIFHAVPALWRLHMVHHTDLDFDVTTGVRFHPLEILLSMAIKLAVVSVLGPPPLAVLIFEVALNGTSMFNHGNLRLPLGLDRVLRLLVVTPDMHRVHHSTVATETNSNFGFNLPWWDRLFGTYRAQPAAGHEDMMIGLEAYRRDSELTFPRLLALPFTGSVGDYPINRRGGD
jgi:sterol desaturase/sphingolipid hydroxylase (fatty acid hydroxylase superfamily)